MILVTGATGTVGNEVVKQLQATGQKFRAMVRSPEKAEVLRKAGVDVVLGDFDRRETYREVLAGVQKLFLLSFWRPQLAEHETAFINAARDAGVQHVVLLSSLGAVFEPGVTLGKIHRIGELALEISGMEWTFLRPNSYMTNFFGNLGSIKGQGMVYGAGRNAKIAVVDPRDVAAVAVKALTEPGHAGKAYALTGPEAVDDVAMTQKMANAIGKALQFVDVPPEAAKAAMVGMGMGEWLASSILEFFQPVGIEGGGKVTGDVQKVLGRPPRSFDDWARDFSGAFR